MDKIVGILYDTDKTPFSAIPRSKVNMYLSLALFTHHEMEFAIKGKLYLIIGRDKSL